MSAFSFTAPIMTAEERKAERDRLSGEEQRELEIDLFGQRSFQEKQAVSLTKDDTKSVMDVGVALKDFQDAVEKISMKEAYTRAKQEAPELVDQESPAIAFLKATHWDATAAACRLVEYWKLRLRIFGQNRAFLPMTLAGAMRDDAEVLKKAVMFEVDRDESGRSVIFLDRVRCLPAIASRDAFVRCFWYTIQSLVIRDDVQDRGYIVLVNMRSYDLYKHFDRILTKLHALTVSCMPVAFKACHCCTGSGSSVLSITHPVIMFMLGKVLRLRVLVHAGSKNELITQLQDYGLGVPHADCVYRDAESRLPLCHAWLLERQLQEQSGGNHENNDDSCRSVFVRE